MTLSITTFSIMTLGMTKFSIKTLNITIFSLKTLSITKFNMQTLSIRVSYVTFSINNILHNDIQPKDIEHSLDQLLLIHQSLFTFFTKQVTLMFPFS